jgi:hypothetical protein
MRYVTASEQATPHMANMVNQQNVEAGMLIRSLVHLTTATIVVTMAVLFAVPFFLVLASPFIGR